MYENHRDNFGRRRFEDERGNREQRWRQGEDRYRREAMGQSRYDQDRYDDRPGDRDEDLAGNAWYGVEQGTYGYRPDRTDSRNYRDRGRAQPRPSQGYASRADYDRPGDSPYPIGEQGSWRVRLPYGSSTYGRGGFGEDYREHDYDHDRYGEHRGFFEKAGDEIASWFGDEEAARRREEDHRGRGPRNYVRSDERIRDDANDRLTDDWKIDASDVTVRVENGEVTLDGTVHDRVAKRRAEDLVEDISGVTHVQNNLRVAGADLSVQNRSTSDVGGMISGAGNAQTSASTKTPETV